METAGKSSSGGGVGGAGGEVRREIKTGSNRSGCGRRQVGTRLAFLSVQRPATSHVERDGLGTPDTILGHAGQKGSLGRAAGDRKIAGTPKKLWRPF